MKTQFKLTEQLDKFRDSFIERALNSNAIEDNSLALWRAKILFTIYLSGVTFGTFALISGIFLVIIEKVWSLLIFDIFAYSLCIFLLFSRHISYTFRASISVLMFYFVGLVIIYSVGPVSGGTIWLFAFAVMAGVLMGTRTAIAAVCINSLTIVIIGWLMVTGRFGQDFPFFDSIQALIAAGINFIVLNLMASLSISVLLKGMITTHEKQIRLKNHLDEEKRLLKATEEMLEIEGKERKQTEEKYRFLADNVNDMLWMLDFIEQRITYVSPSVKKIRGVTPEEAMKQSLEEILVPESYQKAMNVLADELENDIDRDPDRFITIELEQYRNDRSTVWTELTTSFVRNSKNEPIAIIGVTRDISERKAIEKELKEKEEKLARSKKMESLGLMAGGIAHDLNNILSGIVSYPDILLLKLPKGSPLRKPIEIIKESGLRAAAVVSDLLTVSKGAATGAEVLNINKLIKKYLKSPEHISLTQTQSAINFQQELDPGLLNIHGSPVHFQKVLMNLVTNAADSIQDNGTVTISTKNYYLDEPLKNHEDIPAGEYVLLKVSDNGIGIPTEHLKSIFEPFYTKKILGRNGTGLGLAVVWNTIKDHKGHIHVSSSSKGTHFEIFIPATREEIEQKRSDISFEEYRGQGEKILVVDDDENQRNIACDLLNQLGYRSDSVSSGEKAVEYLEKNTADLILLDMIMPGGLSGTETYKKITQIYPYQKAVIASGYAESNHVKEAQKLGAGKYIKKPYTLEEIGLAIKKELRDE